MNNKILFIDDEVSILNLVKVLLEQAGYDVLTASNPDEALQKSKGISFRLIVIDVNLGGDSGIMMLNFLSHDHKGVPFIIYSGGEHEQAAIDKVMAMGATKYVEKRDGSELVAAVSQLCPLS